MRILIINPNTSTEMTETIHGTARRCACPTTEVTTVNPTDGPRLIASAYDLAVQAVRVIDLVERNKDDYDCFIIACGGDPGLDACRTIARNVIGTGESGIMSACTLAKRFSVIGTSKSGAASISQKLASLGIDQRRCASARMVGAGIGDEIVRNRHEMLDVYCEVGNMCIAQDGADVLVLGCAGMSDLTHLLWKRLGIPVISGVISAVKAAEQIPL